MRTRDEAIVVTGARGQLGRAVIPRLQSRGWTVLAVDLEAPGNWRGCEYLSLDLASPGDYCWPLNVSTILHLAGYRDRVGGDAESLRALLTANLLATAGALAAGGESVRHFVFVSSISVYAAGGSVPIPESRPARPSTAYGTSKWLGEQACQIHRSSRPGLEVTTLRLAQVYGPGSPDHLAMYRLLDQLRVDRRLSLQCGPDLIRDYIHLDDAAEALARTCHEAPGLVINVGSGGFPMSALVDAVAALAPEPIPSSFGPHGGAEASLSLGIGRMESVLGFRPRVTLEQGVRREHERLSARHAQGEGQT